MTEPRGMWGLPGGDPVSSLRLKLERPRDTGYKGASCQVWDLRLVLRQRAPRGSLCSELMGAHLPDAVAGVICRSLEPGVSGRLTCPDSFHFQERRLRENTQCTYRHTQTRHTHILVLRSQQSQNLSSGLVGS